LGGDDLGSGIGVNPVTGEQVIDAEHCSGTLAVLATAGLYERSGEWLYEIGLPAGAHPPAPMTAQVGQQTPPGRTLKAVVRQRWLATHQTESGTAGLSYRGNQPEHRCLTRTASVEICTDFSQIASC
jgi:hypothetical protein